MKGSKGQPGCRQARTEEMSPCLGKGPVLLRNRGLDNTTERKLVIRQPAATDIETQQGNVPLSSNSADILRSNGAAVQCGQPWRPDVP
ncbi:hypothetical protein ROHU_006347 [Labeo rohita]|uniref:Uncharacterized protein n=1 Tax=Labeo rohita TaxID=84645 RepID=A0A498MTA2_LABRO|nr:hypothetical protein ROHU_006347 [Labeo rohita]